MDAPQLDLFVPYKHTDPVPSRAVIVVETNIREFGNRTDVIVVDEGTVREMALLESEDCNARYFNEHS